MGINRLENVAQEYQAQKIIPKKSFNRELIFA